MAISTSWAGAQGGPNASGIYMPEAKTHFLYPCRHLFITETCLVVFNLFSSAVAFRDTNYWSMEGRLGQQQQRHGSQRLDHGCPALEPLAEYMTTPSLLTLGHALLLVVLSRVSNKAKCCSKKKKKKDMSGRRQQASNEGAKVVGFSKRSTFQPPGLVSLPWPVSPSSREPFFLLFFSLWPNNECFHAKGRTQGRVTAHNNGKERACSYWAESTSQDAAAARLYMMCMQVVIVPSPTIPPPLAPCLPVTTLENQ